MSPLLAAAHNARSHDRCIASGEIMTRILTVILSAALLLVAVQARASAAAGNAEFRSFETPRLLAAPKTKNAVPVTQTAGSAVCRCCPDAWKEPPTSESEVRATRTGEHTFYRLDLVESSDC